VARSSIRTWLSLDRFAEITGLNPLHFNQLSGQGLLNYDLSCGYPWFQFDWQATEKVSRETLSEAIRRAELLISQTVGYNLVPDWNTNAERVLISKSRDPYLISTGYNARGMRKSVELNKGYYISGGKRAKTLIQAAVAIVATDGDGDGFFETCTATFASTIDVCEVHAYLPGRSGSDAYEIRPITVTNIGGGLYSAVFKRWQVVDPDLQDGFLPQQLENVAATFETTCDIYRVYNDPSVQLTLNWEPGACSTDFSYVAGMLASRDCRRSIVSYRAATWNGTGFDDADCGCLGDPDFLDAYYYSGYVWPDAPCDQVMDPFWEQTVAHLAIAMIDRDLCSCNNTAWMFKKWRDDLAETNEARSFNIIPSDCPFGSRRGELDAWKRCKERRLA